MTGGGAHELHFCSSDGDPSSGATPLEASQNRSFEKNHLSNTDPCINHSHAHCTHDLHFRDFSGALTLARERRHCQPTCSCRS